MIRVRNGKFYFNGQKKDVVIGRSSFKLANIVSYHYTGKGEAYSLGQAREWCAFNQSIFGRDVVLRVLLETAGWDPKSPGMFGSPPQDQGFWNVEKLRDGRRETEMHPVGKKVLRWFFETSTKTGIAFELVIIATLKHDNIPTSEIDHVIRQTGIEMGKLAVEFPRALIIPNVCNEWNAHSKFTVQDVDMWAVRWERDGYWPGAAVIVDGGGGDELEYAVGDGGAYKAAMIHPERTGRDWEQMPDMKWLQRKAGRFPIGFTESMYYVEKEDAERAEQWYRHRSGWTHNWHKYRRFIERCLLNVDYMIFHDEKGIQCNPWWPRQLTRLEAWGKERFIQRPPPPPPPPPVFMRFRRIIVMAYQDILGRDADPVGVDVYNKAMLNGFTEAQLRESLIRSQEYIKKNG